MVKANFQMEGLGINQRHRLHSVVINKEGGDSVYQK